ncbi:MAG: hypothetical protein EBZ58_05955 [Bacteroidetes bacterium]|jgi:hypothetical protein|nr:hypothetical protein [Bacteroidota bacterium]
MEKTSTSMLHYSLRLTKIKNIIIYSYLFLKDALMILYVIVTTMLVLFAIFEIKYKFSIDLIPGVNFLFDDYYREMKDDVMK